MANTHNTALGTTLGPGVELKLSVSYFWSGSPTCGDLEGPPATQCTHQDGAAPGGCAGPAQPNGIELLRSSFVAVFSLKYYFGGIENRSCSELANITD